MSTLEAVRADSDLLDALNRVQDQVSRLAKNASDHPDVFVSPRLMESYDARMVALRWLLGQMPLSPVTKTAGTIPPSYGTVAQESLAADKLLFPGHRRGELPAGIPNYPWLAAVQSALDWAIGMDAPNPAER